MVDAREAIPLAACGGVRLTMGAGRCTLSMFPNQGLALMRDTAVAAASRMLVDLRSSRFG